MPAPVSILKLPVREVLLISYFRALGVQRHVRLGAHILQLFLARYSIDTLPAVKGEPVGEPLAVEAFKLVRRT